MLDSTLIERIGKYLAPDDKIKNSNKLLSDFLESSAFKQAFHQRCREHLSGLKTKTSYYRKYQKRKGKISKRTIEAALQKRAENLLQDSSLLQERISKLEFLFKKIAISKQPPAEPVVEPVESAVPPAGTSGQSDQPE